MNLLKQLAARLPNSWQAELKRIHFKRQIRRGRFTTDEPEYGILHEFVHAGDWVIDVGANVGHYTKRLSDLVGPTGRVIAFEPVPTTFALLAANTQLFDHANVTLIGAAASDRAHQVGIELPGFSSGLINYYQAHIAETNGAGLLALTLSIDSLGIEQKVSLVKMDAEGHEPAVLAGMMSLIRRSRPVMIIESSSREIGELMHSMGYAEERLTGSPNLIFRAL